MARTAFTITELVVVILTLLVLAAVVVVLTFQGRHGSRQTKDAVQVRGIVQALVVTVTSNQSKYPLPSMFDTGDATVAEQGDLKDTTGNILSVMIFAGAISPEICVSPAEVNPAIRVMSAYSLANPRAAVRPENALWDPAFRATPDDPVRVNGTITSASLAGAIGNSSYAHVIPSGSRLKQWADTYNSKEVVFGNRGPSYASDDFAPSPDSGLWTPLSGPPGMGSNTMRIHGAPGSWEGNIGFNDNHVEYLSSPSPAKTLYLREPVPGHGQVPTPDNIFVNESDDATADVGPGRFEKGTNAYLRPISERRADGTIRVWRD